MRLASPPSGDDEERRVHRRPLCEAAPRAALGNGGADRRRHIGAASGRATGVLGLGGATGGIRTAGSSCLRCTGTHATGAVLPGGGITWHRCSAAVVQRGGDERAGGSSSCSPGALSCAVVAASLRCAAGGLRRRRALLHVAANHGAACICAGGH
jgi:hypothetical protein